MPRFSPSGFFGPSRCLIPTPGLTSEYPICAVCVRVCIYTHTLTYTPNRVKNREDTDNTPIFPNVIGVRAVWIQQPKKILLPKITPHAKQQVLS